MNQNEYISFSPQWSSPQPSVPQQSSPQPSVPQQSLPQPSESITRSSRSIRAQVDNIHEAEVLIASARTEINNEPRSYIQAMKSTSADKWQIAIQEELDTLHANNT